jgi:hypothetical protein
VDLSVSEVATALAKERRQGLRAKVDLEKGRDDFRAGFHFDECIWCEALAPSSVPKDSVAVRLWLPGLEDASRSAEMFDQVGVPTTHSERVIEESTATLLRAPAGAPFIKVTKVEQSPAAAVERVDALLGASGRSSDWTVEAMEHSQANEATKRSSAPASSGEWGSFDEADALDLPGGRVVEEAKHA